MMRIIPILLCLSLALQALPARAEVLHALAMSGPPKYGADFKSLDYVNPQAPKGGAMIQAAIGSFDTLNPFNIKGTPAQGLSNVHDRLMQRVWDEPFTMYPLIAEKIDVPEDRSEITFFLNPAARFHDGSPITADDVLFSFETLRQQGRPNMRRVYGLVTTAEKKDDRTVRFAFGPGYDRETVMILAMMPVLSKAWWADRDFSASILDIPVASGPYKIASADPGRKIVYERVPDYWAANLPVNVGHFNFDRLVYDYYRDDTVAFESFKAGGYDLRREWDAGKWEKGYDFPAVEKKEITQDAMKHGRPERVRSLMFNARRPPFDDMRVREALTYILDFDWINTSLFYGLHHRVDSFFPNSELAAKGVPQGRELEILQDLGTKHKLPADILAAEAWAPPATIDPAQQRENLRTADRLLKDAGWIVKDNKRVRTDDPTKTFNFEILLGAPDDEKIALAYARSLARLGIDARVRVLDAAAFTGRMNDYDFDMALHFWLSTLSPGTEQVLYWGCEAADQKARWNFAGVCDPAIDVLAESIAASESRDDLVARVRGLDRLLRRGHYMVPLNYPGVDYVAYKSFIKRPESTPVYGMVIETWWAEPDKSP